MDYKELFEKYQSLLIDYDEGKKRGRKKTRSIIGQLGAGKDNLSGIIDIAVMQSLNRMGEVKGCIWYIAYGFKETNKKNFSHLPFTVCYMKKCI
jgi:hypothetical protein